MSKKNKNRTGQDQDHVEINTKLAPISVKGEAEANIDGHLQINKEGNNNESARIYDSTHSANEILNEASDIVINELSGKEKEDATSFKEQNDDRSLDSSLIASGEPNTLEQKKEVEIENINFDELAKADDDTIKSFLKDHGLEEDLFMEIIDLRRSISAYKTESNQSGRKHPSQKVIEKLENKKKEIEKRLSLITFDSENKLRVIERINIDFENAVKKMVSVYEDELAEHQKYFDNLSIQNYLKDREQTIVAEGSIGKNSEIKEKVKYYKDLKIKKNIVEIFEFPKDCFPAKGVGLDLIDFNCRFYLAATRKEGYFSFMLNSFNVESLLDIICKMIKYDITMLGMLESIFTKLDITQNLINAYIKDTMGGELKFGRLNAKSIIISFERLLNYTKLNLDIIEYHQMKPYFTLNGWKPNIDVYALFFTMITTLVWSEHFTFTLHTKQHFIIKRSYEYLEPIENINAHFKNVLMLKEINDVFELFKAALVEFHSNKTSLYFTHDDTIKILASKMKRVIATIASRRDLEGVDATLLSLLKLVVNADLPLISDSRLKQLKDIYEITPDLLFLNDIYQIQASMLDKTGLTQLKWLFAEGYVIKRSISKIVSLLNEKDTGYELVPISEYKKKFDYSLARRKNGDIFSLLIKETAVRKPTFRPVTVINDGKDYIITPNKADIVSQEVEKMHNNTSQFYKDASYLHQLYNNVEREETSIIVCNNILNTDLKKNLFLLSLGMKLKIGLPIGVSEAAKTYIQQVNFRKENVTSGSDEILTDDEIVKNIKKSQYEESLSNYISKVVESLNTDDISTYAEITTGDLHIEDYNFNFSMNVLRSNNFWFNLIYQIYRLNSSRDKYISSKSKEVEINTVVPEIKDYVSAISVDPLMFGSLTGARYQIKSYLFSRNVDLFVSIPRLFGTRPGINQTFLYDFDQWEWIVNQLSIEENINDLYVRDFKKIIGLNEEGIELISRKRKFDLLLNIFKSDLLDKMVDIILAKLRPTVETSAAEYIHWNNPRLRRYNEILVTIEAIKVLNKEFLIIPSEILKYLLEDIRISEILFYFFGKQN